MPKITLLFASLHALLLLALIVPISRHRHQHKIGLGDGGDVVLARKIRAHANFIEFVPIALLLLALLELGGLPAAWLWGFGALLLLARVMHAVGLSRHAGYSLGRFWGTALTMLVLLAMALAGLWLALVQLLQVWQR
ncbi:MAG TPA: MAPEG family protein [Luteimonas sp.]|nr:MAPEG family protein [Luteimonas sp.]